MYEEGVQILNVWKILLSSNKCQLHQLWNNFTPIKLTIL